MVEQYSNMNSFIFRNFLRCAFAIGVCTISVGTGLSYAQSADVNYDKFGLDQTAKRIRKEPPVNVLLDAPAAMVPYIKAVLREPAVWLEEHHVFQKIRYVYQEITDYGFYPLATDIGDRHNSPPGVEFGYGIYGTSKAVTSGGMTYPLGLQYLKDHSLAGYPLRVNSWARYGTENYRDYGVQFRMNGFYDQDTYIQTTLRYHDNPREDYFGQGPNISIAEAATFSVQEYSGSIAIGRNIFNNVILEVGTIFSSTDISDGNEHDKRPINQYALDGVSGANILGFGISLERDTRDNEFDPKHGGYQRVKAGYYEGVGGDDFGYAKYSFEMAEYLPIGEWFSFLYYDSVLALRVGGEVNDNINGDRIPFFDLARLGGSETVRGYQQNRFFDDNSLYYNVEYRYNIWGFKDYQVNATAFFDGGWIADEISEMELDKHKYSYGLGLRLAVPAFTLALEAARSDEGTEWYLRAKPNF